MVKKLALVLHVVRPKQHLLDVDVFFLGVVDAHALGFAHHAGRQLLNTRCKSRTEHHGLLAVDGQLVDLGQIVREAQIEHAVGFVNDQKLDLVKLDLHRALQIEQAARRGHHQIGVLQLGNLQLVRHAAHNVGNAQTTAVLHQIDGVVRHLLGQFAGGANNQCAGCGRFEVAGVGRVFALAALGRGFALGGGLGHGLFIGEALFLFGLGHLGQ